VQRSEHRFPLESFHPAEFDKRHRNSRSALGGPQSVRREFCAAQNFACP
jgi:hypothetical protein